MEKLRGPRITHAERLNGGVVIVFDDGKCAVFPAALLYAHLDEAEIIPDDEDDEQA